MVGVWTASVVATNGVRPIAEKLGALGNTAVTRRRVILRRLIGQESTFVHGRAPANLDSADLGGAGPAIAQVAGIGRRVSAQAQWKLRMFGEPIICRRCGPHNET